MINVSNAIIKNVVIHKAMKSESIAEWEFSAQPVIWEEGVPTTYLLQHLTNMYKEPLYHQMAGMGPVALATSKIFSSPEALYEESIHLARKLGNLLSEESYGESYFLMAYISDVLIEDELLDIVAIVFMHAASDFYKPVKKSNLISLLTDKGYIIGKPDKACLILPAGEEGSARVLCHEMSGVKDDSFWYKDYLQLIPMGNDYSYTADYIKLTSQFLKQRKPLEQVLDKKQGAEILERSLDYFTQNDRFEENSYKQEVFQDYAVIQAFDDYKQKWAEKNHRPLADAFEPSAEALNKNSRVFRSVIKLDRNFHIYVHGDTSKIMKGEDENGKYYIIYYKEES